MLLLHVVGSAAVGNSSRWYINDAACQVSVQQDSAPVIKITCGTGKLTERSPCELSQAFGHIL